MGVPLNLPYDEKYVQFDYEARTDSNPIYAGFTADIGASDDAEVWTIKKYTYDANAQCTKIRTVFKKAYSARSTLFA